METKGHKVLHASRFGKLYDAKMRIKLNTRPVVAEKDCKLPLSIRERTQL